MQYDDPTMLTLTNNHFLENAYTIDFMGGNFIKC